jgi:hypothetical protein
MKTLVTKMKDYKTKMRRAGKNFHEMGRNGR